MLRIQLIPLARDVVLPGWTVSGFRFDAAQGPEEGLARLREQSCDAVLVVAGDSVLAAGALLTRLQAQLEPDSVPLLLAVDGARLPPEEPIDLLGCDAVLDLRWSGALLAQALALGIARVRSGRAVAAIQRQVLGAVHREVLLLRDLSIRDGLTGLYNFRFFRELLSREHDRCRRYGHPYAVVCFDLDHLRELNNRFGHELGTQALSRVAHTLAAAARSTDYTFRIGGDEFATLLLECNRAFALQYAERVCAAVRACDFADGEVRIPLSVSAGVAAFPQDGNTFETVLRRADAVLYRAKHLGRDRAMASGEGAMVESTGT